MEYTIVLALVVVVATAAWQGLGGQVECTVERASQRLGEALGGPPAPLALGQCHDPVFAARSASSDDTQRLSARADAESGPSAHLRNEDLRFSSSDFDLDVEGEEYAPSTSGRWQVAGKRAVDSAAGFVSGFVPYGSLALSKAPFGNERTFANGQVTGAAAGLLVDAAMIGGGTAGAMATAPAVVTGVGTVVPGSAAAVAAGGMRALPGHALNLAVAKAKLEGAADAPRGGGRGKNKLAPHPEAQGPHTSFKRGPDGRVTGYETYKPSEPQNPNPWTSEKRVDVTGAPHYNKATRQDVPTPHVQSHDVPGGVRPAEAGEIPLR